MTKDTRKQDLEKFISGLRAEQNEQDLVAYIEGRAQTTSDDIVSKTLARIQAAIDAHYPERPAEAAGGNPIVEVASELIRKAHALGVSMVWSSVPGQTMGLAKTSRATRAIRGIGLEWTQADLICSLSVARRKPFSVDLTISGDAELTPIALKWAKPSSVADAVDQDDPITFDTFPVQKTEDGRLEVAIGKGALYRRLEAIEAARGRKHQVQVLLLMPQLMTD